jgi:hypothetical protein
MLLNYQSWSINLIALHEYICTFSPFHTKKKPIAHSDQEMQVDSISWSETIRSHVLQFCVPAKHVSRDS